MLRIKFTPEQWRCVDCDLPAEQFTIAAFPETGPILTEGFTEVVPGRRERYRFECPNGHEQVIEIDTREAHGIGQPKRKTATPTAGGQEDTGAKAT